MGFMDCPFSRPAGRGESLVEMADVSVGSFRSDRFGREISDRRYGGSMNKDSAPFHRKRGAVFI